MFCAWHVSRDQAWRPNLRGSTSCSPPATTSTFLLAPPRDDSFPGRTTGGPCWTAKGSEEAPSPTGHTSSLHSGLTKHRRYRSHCGGNEGGKVKYKDGSDQLNINNNNIQVGCFTKSRLLMLNWERTFTCLTTWGHSGTEREVGLTTTTNFTETTNSLTQGQNEFLKCTR